MSARQDATWRQSQSRPRAPLGWHDRVTYATRSVILVGGLGVAYEQLLGLIVNAELRGEPPSEPSILAKKAALSGKNETHAAARHRRAEASRTIISFNFPSRKFRLIMEGRDGEHPERAGQAIRAARLAVPALRRNERTSSEGAWLPGRETPQCRDVFDLHVLALGGYATRVLFAEKLSAPDRSAARAVIDALEYDAYAGQVVEFLEDEARARFGTSEAWDEMRLGVLELFDDG
jgi:hypothetical protein